MAVMQKKNQEKELPYEELITISQAARLREVSRQCMSTLVKRNRFTVYDGVGRCLLDRREVEAFEPSKGGRPSGKMS